MSDFFQIDQFASPRIKICGIRDVETANIAIDAGAHAIGLVLAERSPRCISWELAERLAADNSARVTPVAVFCNHTIDDVARWNGSVAQLHGDEDTHFIDTLRERRPDVRIIRGFQFSATAVRKWNACDAIDALLIDGSAGGHGAGFQHEKLAAMMTELTKPVMLAGGLTPENVARAIETIHPFAVDVSSGVESSRGVKDAGLIREFCDEVARASRP